MLKIYFLIFLTYFLPFVLLGQDVHFSQFYANPLYLNPALVGTTTQGRFLLNYRTQYPALEGEFVSYNFSYDQHFFSKQSSLGLLFSTDKAGSAGLRSTNVHLLYAYNVPLSSVWGMRGGLQIGYGNRTVDYFKLIFGDQLSPNGLVNFNSQDTNLGGLNIHYLDIASGLALYRNNFWLSVAAHHLNRPNQSITAQNENLEMRVSVQMGYKFTHYRMGARIKEGYTNAWHPMVFYSQQGNFRQLDIGMQTFFKPVTFGGFIRNVPLKPNLNTSLSLLTGFKYKGLNVLYSYDLPISGVARSLGGAHEVGLSLQLDDDTNKKKKINRRKRKKISVANFPSLID